MAPIIDYDPHRPVNAEPWWWSSGVCRPDRHIFTWWSGASTTGDPPKGLRCYCGEKEIEE